MTSSDFSYGLTADFAHRLYRSLPWMWTMDRMRSPLFHRLLSQHSAPPTPESSSRLRFQNLHLFHGLRRLSSGSALSGPFRARWRRCRIPFMVRTAVL